MVFDIWRGLRRRTDPKLDRLKATTLIQCSRSMVLLMSMEFETCWGKVLGETHEAHAPTFVPFTGVNIQPIEIRFVHGEVGDDLLITRANPDGAFRSNEIGKDPMGVFKRQRLPRGKIRVGGDPRTVPNASDFGFVSVSIRANAAACMIHALEIRGAIRLV
jgi:hypothetical protein